MIPREVDTSGQRWNLNTSVKVWIAPSVNPNFTGAIYDAVNSWGAHPQNSAGVTFAFVGSEPAGESNTLVFRQEPLASPAHYSMDPLLKRATIVLSSGITDAAAAQMTAAHEMGHTFGTLDCWQCDPGTSVMVERPADLNDTSGLLGPTDCDLAGAMEAMGATKEVYTDELQRGAGDNEPACFDVYRQTRICWPGNCIILRVIQLDGYCMQ